MASNSDSEPAGSVPGSLARVEWAAGLWIPVTKDGSNPPPDSWDLDCSSGSCFENIPELDFLFIKSTGSLLWDLASEMPGTLSTLAYSSQDS